VVHPRKKKKDCPFCVEFSRVRRDGNHGKGAGTHGRKASNSGSMKQRDQILANIIWVKDQKTVRRGEGGVEREEKLREKERGTGG